MPPRALRVPHTGQIARVRNGGLVLLGLAIADQPAVFEFPLIGGAEHLGERPQAEERSRVSGFPDCPAVLTRTIFIKNDPPLASGATTGMDRLVIFGGGYPLKIDGQVVGAIGVSGGHYTQDMEVAQAALAILEAAAV
jgi:hypothetical protein